MEPIDLLGLVAGTLTTLAFVPQVRKAWKSGQTRDISLVMFATFTLGVALWLVYGLWLGSWPLILSNIVTLGLAGAILVLKIRNRD
ncbi:MAG: SemiSWEET family sugar transporter [Rhodospirillales bacterium]|nr:SemiSWEET family sugar transporter [Rhodospirillales bacterium]